MKAFQILEGVAAHSDLPVNVLRGRSRMAHVAETRAFVMYICVMRFGLPYERAGRIVCRTRSNAAKMVSRIRDRMLICKHTRERYKRCVEAVCASQEVDV